MLKKKSVDIISDGVPRTPEGFYLTGWGNALLVPEGMGGILVGKLLTIIESFGLPQSQERAVKDIIRNEVYDAFDSAWIIGEESHVMLREKAFNFGQLSVGGHMPPNFPSYATVGYASGSSVNVPSTPIIGGSTSVPNN